MDKWITIVGTNCADPAREKEYNDWYDNVHLPDILATPGFITANRYVEKEFRDGRGKYLTIYQIETDDIDKTMALRRERRKQEMAQGHYHELLVRVWRDVLWRPITERIAGE